MKELDKIPQVIKDKYGVEYNKIYSHLTISRPQLITIQTPLDDIEVEEYTTGFQIRTERVKIVLMNDFTSTVTSIF